MYHLSMIGKAEVRALEECAFNGWPARQTLLMGGWILRLSGGYTKRANSVNALEPVIPFQDILEAAELFYARHTLPTIFRLSPLAPLEADAILDAAGYVSFDPTLVLTVSLGAQYGPCETRIDEMPTTSWLDGFALAAGIKDAKRAIHDAMVSAIAVRTAFATVYDAGEAVGFGLAAYERRTIGIFDIAVFPSCRRRGHGRSIMNALLAWGKKLGAKQAFLQVDEQNGIARNLYGSLGFGEAYRYHYRKRPNPEAFNVE
jgi:ribosomal protein S18 acetylase RimI-like enzyme